MPTTDGGRVRRNRLFRSDAPTRLTSEDHDTLVGVGLRTVLDLRTAQEIEQYGVPAWPVDGPVHLPVRLTEHELLPGAVEIATWTDPRAVAEYYVRILEHGDEPFARILDLLADAGAVPVLVHCMSGRDRTALVVALLLGIAGVADEHVLADYARSGPALLRMRGAHLRDAPEEMRELLATTDVLTDTPPENLALFLAELRRRFGSVEGYVAHLGRTGQAAAVRSHLREVDG